MPRIPKNTPLWKWKVVQNLDFEFHYARIANPPPPPKENLARTWHSENWLPKNRIPPPPPLLMKCLSGLGTLSSDYPRILFPNRPIPPPPRDENFARTWHFELFWLPKSTPPKKSCCWSVWRLIAVSPKDTVSFGTRDWKEFVNNQRQKNSVQSEAEKWKELFTQIQSGQSVIFHFSWIPLNSWNIKIISPHKNMQREGGSSHITVDIA